MLKATLCETDLLGIATRNASFSIWEKAQSGKDDILIRDMIALPMTEERYNYSEKMTHLLKSATWTSMTPLWQHCGG